jgi:hypothetical protein
MKSTKRGQPNRNRPRRMAGSSSEPVRIERPNRIVALSLAHEMAAAVGAKGDDLQDLVFAALTTGEWLAEVGRPGCWETLEVDQVLRLLPADNPFERGNFLLALTGLLGYAGIEGHLAPAHACKSLEQIAKLAEDAIIQNFARQAAAQVRGSAEA